MARTRKTPSWKDHVASGIVDAAARVLATDRDASMTDIAAAAGMGRATLYRYFPTREALLVGLATAGIDELVRRIAEADLDNTPAREAIARVARAVVMTGHKYIALADLDSAVIDKRTVERQVMAPLHALLQRGAVEGALRDDLAPEMLLTTFVGLLTSVITLSIRDGLGVEHVSAAATTLFLDGAARRNRAYPAPDRSTRPQ
jgi:TetR/AcrR family transcriptional repressor of mexCD-oprJ operon